MLLSRCNSAHKPAYAACCFGPRLPKLAAVLAPPYAYVHNSEQLLWPAPGSSLFSLSSGTDLPVYSFDGDDWTGTIPALEYGGFLPVGAAKMLPDYNGPSWGLAPRHDLAFFYGNHQADTCQHGALRA